MRTCGAPKPTPGETNPPEATAPAVREGDWICPACSNVNYATRVVCNMRSCGAPKPVDNPPADAAAQAAPEAPVGNEEASAAPEEPQQELGSVGEQELEGQQGEATE